jgi:hypothetical protein
MQTSQGYIFCILQHFVTKFCNFTDFNKLFTGIYFFLPKSKISLTCKLSIKSAFNLILYQVPQVFFDKEWSLLDLLRAAENCEIAIQYK